LIGRSAPHIFTTHQDRALENEPGKAVRLDRQRFREHNFASCTPPSKVIVVFLLIDYFPILFPVAAFFYMFWVFWMRTKEPKPDSATVQYEPPENLTPAECGTLLKNTVDVGSVTATIIDLSVKGYLTIQQKEASNAPGELKDYPDYFFHLIRPLGDWHNLKPHERNVLSAIFIPTNPLRMLTEAMSELQKAGGNSALNSTFSRVQDMTAANPALRALSEAGNDPQPSAVLSELRSHFPLHLARIRNSIFDALQAGGYYMRRPDRVRLLYVAKGFTIGLLMVLMGGYRGAAGGPWISWASNGVLTALIICGFGWFMPARSITGVRALAKIRGFRDFLGRVEKDHIERLENTPEVFEKYLPYAMALSVATKWAEAFAGLAVPPPQWYRGKGSDFFPVHLFIDLNTMSEQTASQTTSTPIGGASGQTH
jgi:Predicted membrane protein (DUF2207)